MPLLCSSGAAFGFHRQIRPVTKTNIPSDLRRQVSEDSHYKCGYCHTAQRIVGGPMVIDHIVPISRGGLSERGNLWLACRRCNEFKGARIEAVDPQTSLVYPLFNPRTQSWSVHFAWSRDGTEIVGLTAIGRATVAALRLNNSEIVGARILWVQAGWHPPIE
ncbi:MAG: HNH endonuclease [Chloroflexi bacterium]|nr:HNH endonuclease [Chloroflexota bacterium]